MKYAIKFQYPGTIIYLPGRIKILCKKLVLEA